MGNLSQGVCKDQSRSTQQFICADRGYDSDVDDDGLYWQHENDDNEFFVQPRYAVIHVRK